MDGEGKGMREGIFSKVSVVIRNESERERSR